MITNMWVRLLLILTLTGYSTQECEMFKKTVNIYMTERVLYRYITCSGITPETNLRAEIMSIMNSSSQYLEIVGDNLPEINQKIFLSMNLTQLKIQANVNTILPDAFKSSSISYIILDNNHIKKLPGSCFNSTNVYVVSIQNNSLTDISPDNFKGLKYLRKLKLGSNQIVNIQPGAFNDLLNINEMNLSYNKLNSIPSELFSRMELLQTLYLNNNILKTLDKHLFVKCKMLQYLYVQHNFFSNLDGTLYPSSILVINASYNHLSSIIFSNLFNLDTLDLNWNKLTTTKDSLENLPALKYLLLNFNFLGPVLNIDFQQMRNISVIEIDNNQITKVDFGIFKNLRYIKGVSFSGNNLTCIDFTNLTISIRLLNLSSNSISEVKNLSNVKELVTLELSNNKLEHISFNMFANLTSLKNLIIGHNLIGKLDLGCFRDLSSLVELNLNHNNIYSLEGSALNGMNVLERLDLSYNNITNINEDVFHNTKHLTVLNISYNKLNNSVDIKQIMSHFMWPRQINLIGNTWTCSSLINVVRETKFGILTRGTSYNVSNVYGIPCINVDDEMHYDKYQYLVDISKLMKSTTANTKDISFKLSVNNFSFIVLIILLCAKVLYDKYSSHVVASRQFLYKKTDSEQEIQLV